ncbi:MAG: hypothetical protein QW421_06025, partial [Archaeoglobaceae archaeon]
MLLALLVTPAMAQPQTNKGPESYPDLAIDRIKLSDDEVNVGSAIKIEVDWGFFDKKTGTRYVLVIPWVDYRDIKKDDTIDFAKALDKAKFRKALPEDGGSADYEFSPV